MVVVVMPQNDARDRSRRLGPERDIRATRSDPTGTLAIPSHPW